MDRRGAHREAGRHVRTLALFSRGMTGEALRPGDEIAGRYRIVRPIGAGGMGAVYEAEQIALARKVALKLVLDEDPRALARFEQEGRALARIDHPNVVRVIDYVAAGETNRAVLVMDLLQGESLLARIRRQGRLSIADTITIASSVLEGLAAIHASGIVHRDLKPSNVFLTKDGAKIVDFGIVKVHGGPHLTTVAGVIGTPSYIAPEQLQGEPADARTDLHAVGVCMYEMLTGERMWKARAGAELAAEIIRDEPMPLHEKRPDVPRSLAEVIHRALAKRPTDRFSDASSMLLALRRPLVADTIVSGRPVTLPLADAPITGATPSMPSPAPLLPIPPPVPPGGFLALFNDPMRVIIWAVVAFAIFEVALRHCGHAGDARLQ